MRTRRTCVRGWPCPSSSPPAPRSHAKVGWRVRTPAQHHLCVCARARSSIPPHQTSLNAPSPTRASHTAAGRRDAPALCKALRARGTLAAPAPSSPSDTRQSALRQLTLSSPNNSCPALPANAFTNRPGSVRPAASSHHHHGFKYQAAAALRLRAPEAMAPFVCALSAAWPPFKNLITPAPFSDECFATAPRRTSHRGRPSAAPLGWLRWWWPARCSVCAVRFGWWRRRRVWAWASSAPPACTVPRGGGVARHW